ncbi:TsoY family (seleno)protein [Polycladidibacter hongkongensis]|uniref:TsoY family (seleno)protein n=1 Tax=Polycladidibacter hongkongensis TaxID=1647556 RepID=UPI0008303ADF|nr:hypothetical protein [Pseudovibrio hongkongensis]
MKLNDNMQGSYSPLYFLSSVGAGGLAISFFMYLMWLTPHKGSPIPSFTSLQALFAGHQTGLQIMAVLALLGVAYFAFTHLRLLLWNLSQFKKWRQSAAYSTFVKSNAESQVMALPLTFAMTMNALFIAGALFVPELWEQRELLFPVSLLAFSAIGIYGTRIYLNFISRVLAEGGFDCAKNNSLGQMVAVFAFSMIGVGFSAVAAMSHVKIVSVLGFVGATLFITAAIVLGLIKLVLGFRAMMEHSAAAETTPTLWILIPLTTVVAIALYRLKMALAHNFDMPVSAAGSFAFFTAILAIQLLFAALGWAVMKRVGYYSRWISGPERSAGAYTLVCPGVALFVLGNFFVNIGLVKLGLVTSLSLAHLALYAPLVLLQLITVWLFLKLNRKLLASPTQTRGGKPRAA